MSDGKFKAGDRVKTPYGLASILSRNYSFDTEVYSVIVDGGARHNIAIKLLSPAPDPRREQVGGDHYTRLAVQPWDVIIANGTPETIYGFFDGNVEKYRMRAPRKGGLEDLKKCRDYLDRLISLVEQGKAACGKVTQPEGDR